MKGMNSHEIRWVKDLLKEIEELKTEIARLQAKLAEKEK